MNIQFNEQGSSLIDQELFERVLQRWEATVENAMKEGFSPPETLVLGLSSVIDEVVIQMYRQYKEELGDKALTEDEFKEILRKSREAPENSEEVEEAPKKPKLKLM